MTEPEHDLTYDLVDDTKALCFGIASLLVSGIDRDSLIIDLAVTEFLENHVIEEGSSSEPEPEKDPVGWIIRDRWDGREIAQFEGTLYRSEEEAKASIDQAYARPDYNEFDILPLYL